MTYAAIINQVQLHIKENELKDALDCLENYFQHDQNSLQSVILFSRRLAAIKKQEYIGNLDATSRSLSYNDLSSKILNFVYTYEISAVDSSTPAVAPLKQDQPFKRAIVRSVVLRILHENKNGLCIADLLQLAGFERSGYKRQFRKLVMQSLEEMKTAEIVETKRENKLTCFRLSAKGLQLLEGFKDTMFFKEKEE